MGLDRGPSDAFEVAQTLGRRRGFNLTEIVPIDHVVEIEIPPTVVVERHFGAPVVLHDLVEIPLIRAIAGDTCELSKVVAHLQRHRIAHRAVVTESGTSGVRGLGIQRKITSLLKEGALVEVDAGIAAQEVRGVDQIGHPGHPVMRPLGPAAIAVAPGRIDGEQEFDRIVQPLLGLGFLAQHRNAGRDQHRRNRPHRVAVIGKDMDRGVLDRVIGHLPRARQQALANDGTLVLAQFASQSQS